MAVPDDRLRLQFKTDECFENAKKYVGTDISAFVAGRNAICKNRTTSDGWGVEQFAPDDLILVPEKGEMYCFRKSDAYDLLEKKKNPYTKRPFDAKTIIELQNAMANDIGSSLPLQVQLDDLDLKGRCPLWRSSDPKIVYSYSCDNTLDDSTFFRKEKVMGVGDVCVGSLFKIYLKTPYTDQTTKADIDHYEKISCTVVEKEPRPTAGEMVALKTYPNLSQSLKFFMGRFGRDLPKADIKEFYDHPEFRSTTPLTLYRGLSFTFGYDSEGTTDFKDFVRSIGKKRLNLGDTFTLKGKKQAESWSTNVCVSAGFALSSTYGIVVEYVAQPDEIIVDTRRLSDRKDLYKDDQAEIILASFDIKTGAPYERKVKVHQLIRRGIDELWQKSLPQELKI